MKKTDTSVLYLVIFLLHVFMVGAIAQNYLNSSDTIVLAGEVSGVEVEIVPTLAPASPTPTPSFNNEIEQYVYDKFGEDHYEKAFEVIKCESGWKATAYNDNRTWGGVGEDKGYWQINNVYHPHITEACAQDIKCSTDYSYRMWINDGKSFKRWTCGKNLGI